MSLFSKLLFIAGSVFAASATIKKETFVQEGHNTHPILKDRVSGHRYRHIYRGRDKTLKDELGMEARKQARAELISLHELQGQVLTPDNKIYSMYHN